MRPKKAKALRGSTPSFFMRAIRAVELAAEILSRQGRRYSIYKTHRLPRGAASLQVAVSEAPLPSSSIRLPVVKWGASDTALRLIGTNPANFLERRFRNDDSPSDQPMGYVAPASVDPSQRRPPPASSSLVEVRRVWRWPTNGIAQSARLASQFFALANVSSWRPSQVSIERRQSPQSVRCIVVS
jgi:hypothetical protein